MRHLFNCIDVMAVLPTGFGKSLIFQMFVMMCGVRNKELKTKNRLLEYHRDFSISKHNTRSSKWPVKSSLNYCEKKAAPL